MSENEQMLQFAKTGTPQEVIDLIEKQYANSNQKGRIFIQIGSTLFNHSYYSLAISVWDRALNYCGKIDRVAEAACHLNIGSGFVNLGNLAKAITHFEKALSIAKENQDQKTELDCYNGLGVIYHSLSDFSRATQNYEKSLKLAEDLEDLTGQANGYTNLGALCHNASNYDKAIAYQKKSLEIALKTSDKLGECRCLINLGNSHGASGNVAEAINCYEKALTIAQETKNPELESLSINNLGCAFGRLGDFSKSIIYHEKALVIASAIGNKNRIAQCNLDLANTYLDKKDFSKAITYFEKGLTVARELGNRAIESECCSGLSAAHGGLGDKAKALNFSDSALKTSNETLEGEAEYEVRSCCSLANDCYLNGEFWKAITYYEKALAMTQDWQFYEIPMCHLGLGNVYFSLGDYSQALSNYSKALKESSEALDNSLESTCHMNLGDTYNGLCNFIKAIPCFEKGLTKAKKIGDTATESRCYNGLGYAHFYQKNFSEAVNFYKQALAIAESIADRHLESKIYVNLGAVCESLNDCTSAQAYYERAIQRASEISDVNSERIAYALLGKLISESNPIVAYDCCKKSITLGESISGGLIEEKQIATFNALASEAYKTIVPLCLKLGKENEAFWYVESSKSRAFLNLLSATKIQPTVELRSELQPLIMEETKCLEKIRAIQTRYLNKSSVYAEPGETERLFYKLDEVYRKIGEYDPEYVYSRTGKPITIEQIKLMLSSLDRNVLLVEYFSTAEKTMIFAVSKNELHVKTVSLPETDIQRYVNNFRKEVVQYPNFRNIGQSWLDLSKYLIEPLKDLTKNDQLIYFVPYGILHYLPLHALEVNGEPLIKNHSVAYSPSASLLRFFLNKGTGAIKECSCFGVDYEEEAKCIADIFDRGFFKKKPNLGSIATKKEVPKKAKVDALHFSCHGIFSESDPLSSGIKLYDGILTAEEIYHMRLNNKLITLSACQTGISKRSQGDELTGLTRAFLYAGAGSVIVSLWSVDALSTKELMFEFYSLIKSGKNRATALQEAQKKIMKTYPHTYYWAPFILTGNFQ